MSLKLSKKSVIPYLIRSFFAREAISPLFDKIRRGRHDGIDNELSY